MFYLKELQYNSLVHKKNTCIVFHVSYLSKYTLFNTQKYNLLRVWFSLFLILVILSTVCELLISTFVV